jgi:hypothetical protein
MPSRRRLILRRSISRAIARVLRHVGCLEHPPAVPPKSDHVAQPRCGQGEDRIIEYLPNGLLALVTDRCESHLPVINGGGLPCCRRVVSVPGRKPDDEPLYRFSIKKSIFFSGIAYCSDDQCFRHVIVFQW